MDQQQEMEVLRASFGSESAEPLCEPLSQGRVEADSSRAADAMRDMSDEGGLFSMVDYSPDPDNQISPSQSIELPLPVVGSDKQSPPAAAPTKPHINLCQAVRSGNKQIVQQWIKYNMGDPGRNHKKDKCGLTPIHYAAKFNQLEIMQLLCDEGSEGIDPKVIWAETDAEQRTPLHLSARYNHYSVSEDSEHDDQPDSGEQTKVDQQNYDRQQSSKKIIEFLTDPSKASEIDVNAGDKLGITPLHLACQVGNIDGVEVLINKDEIELNAKDRHGDTPLHEACYHGKDKIAKLLLVKMKKKNVLNLETKNNSDMTPLHLACREGHKKTVDLLLEMKYCENPEKRKQLVTATDSEGANALHLACRNDKEDIVDTLLKENATLIVRRRDGATPVHVAAQFGCVRVMKKLLKSSPSSVNEKDTYNQTPLHFAAENGKVEVMEHLLEKGANKEAQDIDDYTPLLTAAEFGRTECFKRLLQSPRPAAIDVKNKDRKNAVFLAAESNHPDIIEEVLKPKYKDGNRLCLAPDSFLNTPLHVAAERGNVESLVVLLKCKEVKKDAKNVLGKTPMHLAAEKGHLLVITELDGVCSEAVKSTDQDGNTPLHLACKHGYVEVASHLISKGADIEARNAVQWTPLACAAHHGHAKVIELLVSVKTESDVINSEDKVHNTPLQLAAKEGHVTAVETLLQHNASMSSKDVKMEFNALDWAIENGHSDVAETIIKSHKWGSALTNYTKTQNGEITSPFRKLIQKMPDVAEMVLNRCTTTNANANANDKIVRPDSEDYSVTFDYSFLEDRDRALRSTENSENQPEGGFKNKIKNTWCNFSHPKVKHPMKVMVESECTTLLKHPLVYNLIENKWNSCGRAIFWTLLTFQIVFLIFLMSFALTVLNPFSPTCIAVSAGQFNLTGGEVYINTTQLHAPHDSVLADYISSTNMSATVSDGIAQLDGSSICFNATEAVQAAVDTVVPVQPLCGQCGQSEPKRGFVFGAAVIIIIYSVIRLIMELVCFIQQLHLYLFDLTTWVDVALYISSIIFVFVFPSTCFCPKVWQWQIGIIAVLFVWVQLILYIRRMRLLDTGIYILMFKKIFYRFLKLTILTVLLLLMFAFTFFMTFRQFHPLFDRSPFASPLSSIWKTVAMSIGELDYDDVFRQPTGGSMDDVPNIPFPAISHILWLLFVILMPILFGNLLVGLAVDDIKGILEAAALRRLALRVELVLSLENRFMWFFMHIPYLKDKKQMSNTIHPYQSSFKTLIVPLRRLFRGENYSSVEHISRVLNPTKSPLELQTQTLMREISKMQEMLKEIPKMQETMNVLLKQNESRSRADSES